MTPTPTTRVTTVQRGVPRFFGFLDNVSYLVTQS